MIRAEKASGTSRNGRELETLMEFPPGTKPQGPPLGQDPIRRCEMVLSPGIDRLAEQRVVQRPSKRVEDQAALEGRSRRPGVADSAPSRSSPLKGDAQLDFRRTVTSAQHP